MHFLKKSFSAKCSRQLSVDGNFEHVEKRHVIVNPRKPVNSAVPVPVKSTGVQFILVLPRTKKS
jgi:hypothetical protein